MTRWRWSWQRHPYVSYILKARKWCISSLLFSIRFFVEIQDRLHSYGQDTPGHHQYLLGVSRFTMHVYDYLRSTLLLESEGNDNFFTP